MPYCPECRFEYRPGVKTCPECKLDLVDKLEDLTTNVEDFVQVYMVSDRQEASIIETLFEENKIELLVQDQRDFPVLPDFGRKIDLRIAVPAHQEADARKLLEEARADGALAEQGKFL
jgi:hypothetical protein